VLTWKPKVTKFNRLLFQLAPSTLRTEETGYGFLATPNTMDSMAPKTEKAVLREATVTRPGRTKMSNLRDQLWHGVKLEPGGEKTRLPLQPSFALWIMGYPTDWCDLEAGEMPPSKARVTQSSLK
jgi:hypothetical protein